MKNELVQVNFKVMPISSSGRIWDKFYPLDPIHFVFLLLVSIEISQEIELISIAYLIML